MHVNMEIIVPTYVYYVNMDMVPHKYMCVYVHMRVCVYICRYVQSEKKKKIILITSPIPMPNTKRPMTITGKSGANAVTRAPTKYNTAAKINSLFLPLVQIHHINFIKTWQISQILNVQLTM